MHQIIYKSTELYDARRIKPIKNINFIHIKLYQNVKAQRTNQMITYIMVSKTIYSYSESPMYTVLEKDTIKNMILPHLSKQNVVMSLKTVSQRWQTLSCTS